MESKKHGEKTVNLIQFIAGIILAITGAVLMFLGILPVSTSNMIGIVGLGLIATSN